MIIVLLLYKILFSSSFILIKHLHLFLIKQLRIFMTVTVQMEN